jgi:hypothetical protein
MHASNQPCRLIRVTGLALHRSDLIRMRIVLDGRVAIAAFENAVNAGAELVRIDPNIMPGCVLHTRIRVAGQAIRLRLRPVRRSKEQKCGQGQRDGGNGLHLSSE